MTLAPSCVTFAGVFGPRSLAVDLLETGQLAAVVSCQPLLVGHVIYAQLWSRNATSAGDLVTAAEQRLRERGVAGNLLRQVTQAGCPDYAQ